MTAIQAWVEQDLLATPPGHWTTYGDSSIRLYGHKRAARAIGNALRAVVGRHEHPTTCPLPVWRMRISTGEFTVSPASDFHPSAADRARLRRENDVLWVQEGGRMIDGVPDPALRRPVD